MTLQERIDNILKKSASTVTEYGNLQPLIRKQSEMLKMAKEALESMRLCTDEGKKAKQALATIEEMDNL